ncbi:TPA: hypothetical protein N0F65_012415 [Lagenidium giganteum]|uniref:Translin n=1 Tax=Lagenidium giganteum TaxID=4803 RepID=A0AAV2YLZ0_9STRA|nr:TPA: hypothetical protein N0F65_012415 [Lagenidium giganteum]
MASEAQSKKRKMDDATNAPTLADGEMLDATEFVDMNKAMHEHDEMREQIIKRSREILKNSKQAIFALHRGAKPDALQLLAKAENVIPELVVIANEQPSLRQGSLAAAMEEYVEAKCFLHYLDTGRLQRLHDLKDVEREEYLGGVIDFTGELARLAIVKATARDVAEVERCHKMVNAIFGQLIQFDFRNGSLRKKFDAVKYNLRKLENTLYELSLVTNSGLTVRAQSTEDVAETNDVQAGDD